MLLNQFQSIGRLLFNRGLVSSQSGNLSIRMGERLIITRRGSNLGALQEKDLIETGISRNDRATPWATIELSIHRAIYQNTPAKAVVHAHPTHVTALSMIEKVIDSEHLENFCDLGPVTVVGWDTEAKTAGMPEIIADQLKENRIVVVHGHGSFAVGQLLEEAYNCTTGLEEASEILYLLKSLHMPSINRR
jgi:L-fuculose-phosphate aldolase